MHLRTLALVAGSLAIAACRTQSAAPPPSAPRPPPTARPEAPRPAPPPNPLVQLDAQGDHTCGVRKAGDVLCWGRNTYGQLGDRTREDRARLVKVGGLGGVVEVAVGVDFSCARLSDGGLRCWGNNQDGQLGDGRGARVGAMSPAPVAVQGIRQAQQLSAGDFHACALDRERRVWCWGHGANGQIGSDAARAFAAPRPIDGLAPVSAVAAGAEHVCALEARGTVMCWGRNTEGQLGDGESGSRIRPVRVAGIDDATAIASGGNHTCVLRKGGVIACWGDNDDAQLGAGGGAATERDTPVLAATVSEVAQLEAGFAHNCVRQRSGRVSCWGANGAGQLGHRAAATRRSVPTPVRGAADAIELALGRAHSCALAGEGRVHCWGSNEHGALGPYGLAG